MPYAGYLLIMKKSFFDSTLALKKFSSLNVFEDKRCYQRIFIFNKTKVHFLDSLSRRLYFWDIAVPCGSENSHYVVQLNRNEEKYFLLNPNLYNVTFEEIYNREHTRNLS